MKIPYSHIPSVGGSDQPIPSVNTSTVPLKHVISPPETIMQHKHSKINRVNFELIKI